MHTLLTVFITTLSLATLTSSTTYSTPIQIIHTNDLHSYFSGLRDGRAGYARVRTVIDQLRQEAASQGIESIVVDAGDFGEGTSFFLTGQGVDSIKMIENLGIEVSVVGNHDHLLGGNVLGEQITQARLQTLQVTSANIVFAAKSPAWSVIRPTATLRRAGLKIKVIGLSTEELHFQYPLQFEGGMVLPPVPVAQIQESFARTEGADLIVALTHLGVSTDKKLVKTSEEIDVVIGGHSHTFLDEVEFQKNALGRKIPIVQAGAQGLAVGSLIIDVQGPRQVKVLSYRLLRTGTETQKNADLEQKVEQAIQDRNLLFKGRWNDLIGFSDIKLSGYEEGHAVVKKTCWGTHMARMAREAAGADIGLHLANFEGEMIPPGSISYGDMVDNFPHIRKYGDPGWRIATARMSGGLMILIVEALENMSTDFGVNLDGIRYKTFKLPKWIPWIGGKKFLHSFKINNKSVSTDRSYSFAFPAEVGYAIRPLLGKKIQKILPQFQETDLFYWDVMEAYIKKNSPIRCSSTSTQFQKNQN